MAKTVNVVDWSFEKGILDDKNDNRKVQNAIRWVKRNLKIGTSFVCVKRGVYEAELVAIERAYEKHKLKALETSNNRKKVMLEVNAKRKAAREGSNPALPTVSGGLS